jgi:hypothetical protein
MNRERSHPPALASWLLWHLSPKKNREALAGDLFESFSQGHSAGWFWRQVLIAVLVGASRELSARWLQICFAGAGMALLWGSSWITRNSALEHLRLWGIGLPWPVSAVYSVGLAEILRAVIVLPMFAVLLLVTGSFGWVRMIRALFISLVLFAIGDLAVFWWLSGHRVDSYSQAWTALVFKEARFFFALLISAWVTCPLPGQPKAIAQ